MARNDSASGSQIGGGLLRLFWADRLFQEIVYEGVNRPVFLSIPLRAALKLVERMEELSKEDND